jgi:hypothetical protein
MKRKGPTHTLLQPRGIKVAGRGKKKVNPLTRSPSLFLTALCLGVFVVYELIRLKIGNLKNKKILDISHIFFYIFYQQIKGIPLKSGAAPQL